MFDHVLAKRSDCSFLFTNHVFQLSKKDSKPSIFVPASDRLCNYVDASEGPLLWLLLRFPTATSFSQHRRLVLPTPYASTVIGVLKAAMRLVEGCCHLPETSPALHKLREAVQEVTAELEVIARNEANSEFHTVAENFYSNQR